MTARAYVRTRGPIVATACVVALACAASCSETGPAAPARESGCIGADCFGRDGGPLADGGAGDQGDGGPEDGGVVYGHPLEGTSRKATLVAGGFLFTEGPVWIGGRLLFTDIPSATIHELGGDGKVVVFRDGSGGANGLAIDQQGRLIACEGDAKRVSRSAPTKGAATTTIAEVYAGEPLNAPNDVVVRADGNVYFTDPNYSNAPNTQDDEAVYRIDPAGELTRVAHDFQKPNGIALSPDGATLYVVDNGAGKLLSAPVDGAGAVGSFAVLAETPGGDGMAVDDAGNLYVADANGIDVFDSSGTALGTIAVEVTPTNCTFGGPDRRTLYITANGARPSDGGRNPSTGLYSIRLVIPGLP